MKLAALISGVMRAGFLEVQKKLQIWKERKLQLYCSRVGNIGV